MARTGKKKWVWVGAAVLGCLIVLFAIALRPPAKPEAEIVFIEAEKVLKEPNGLQRWVEALRLKLVTPNAVMIGAEIVSSDRLTSMTKAGEILGRKPLAAREDTQVWIVNQDELERVVDTLIIRRTNLIANPRMMMEVGQLGAAFIGRSVPMGGTNIDVGLSMRMKALRAETKTDLFLSALDTQLTTGSNQVGGVAVRTNIHIGARVQLPAQHRILFVCDRKDGKGPVLIVVSAVWQ